MTSPAYAVEQRVATAIGAQIRVAGSGPRLRRRARDPSGSAARRSGCSSRARSRPAPANHCARRWSAMPMRSFRSGSASGWHTTASTCSPGILTVVPVVQSAVIDAFGRALLGGPAWGWVGLQPGTVFPIQLGCVVLGAAGSLALVQRSRSAISRRGLPSRRSRGWRSSLSSPRRALWILSQPMEMRAVGFLG